MNSLPLIAIDEHPDASDSKSRSGSVESKDPVSESFREKLESRVEGMEPRLLFLFKGNL